MSGILAAYLNTQKVGRLWLGKGRDFNFQYDTDWLASESAIPLSLSLPLQAAPFGPDRTHPFFSNLLPESELRRLVARKLGLSEKNDFALLEAVGGECAGALTLLPESRGLTSDGNYRRLSGKELDSLIAELPGRPLLAGEEGIRLSLAGAQNKLPVYFDGEAVSLPMGSAPSSHILKPPTPYYPETVQNETFCMQLAARLGLPVPKVTILKAQQPLYLIERYDRERNAEGKLIRLHQEDFCQALGVDSDRKYEKEGGPGLKDCFDLLREHSIQPVIDLRMLLEWVIFNYLIGNADAHAKNISLMLTPQGPKLAPFYDIMSTAVYPELTERLAMKIGGEDRPKWIQEGHWEKFAGEVGIAYKLVKSTLHESAEKLLIEQERVQKEFVQDGELPKVLVKIVQGVKTRCEKLG